MVLSEAILALNLDALLTNFVATCAREDWPPGSLVGPLGLHVIYVLLLSVLFLACFSEIYQLTKAYPRMLCFLGVKITFHYFTL